MPSGRGRGAADRRRSPRGRPGRSWWNANGGNRHAAVDAAGTGDVGPTGGGAARGLVVGRVGADGRVGGGPGADRRDRHQNAPPRGAGPGVGRGPQPGRRGRRRTPRPRSRRSRSNRRATGSTCRGTDNSPTTRSGDAQWWSDFWWGGGTPSRTPASSPARWTTRPYYSSGFGEAHEQAAQFAAAEGGTPGETNALQHAYWQAYLAYHYSARTHRRSATKPQTLQAYGNPDRPGGHPGRPGQQRSRAADRCPGAGRGRHPGLRPGGAGSGN